MPKKMFNEFDDIEIPSILQGPEWEDDSWHNDITAKVRYTQHPKDLPYQLYVFVEHADPEEREGDSLYWVSLYEKYEDGTEAYIGHTDCNDLQELQRAIENDLEKLNFLYKNPPTNEPE